MAEVIGRRPDHAADDEVLIRQCIEEATRAAANGDMPFGAVLTEADGRVIARAGNTQVSTSDPTAHAEINVLRAGGSIRRSSSLEGCRIYVNAEPCSMCLSAIVKAGIGALVYGASHEPHLDPYLPAVDVLAKTRRPPRVTAGVLADACAAGIASARGATGAVD